VVIPAAPAGSAILFTESLTHGTAAWTGKHQRRTLLYKYCVSHTAWSSRRVRPPANVALTARQQLLFVLAGEAVGTGEVDDSAHGDRVAWTAADGGAAA